MSYLIINYILIILFLISLCCIVIIKYKKINENKILI